MVINIIRIYKEWVISSQITMALICDIVLCIAIIVIDLFYFLEIHPMINDFILNHISILKKADGIIRKILKSV